MIDVPCPPLAAACDTQSATDLEPLVDTAKSDSANLDSSLELLVQAGKGTHHTHTHPFLSMPPLFASEWWRCVCLRAGPMDSLMTLVPEAYNSVPDLDPAVRDFYEYHAGIQVHTQPLSWAPFLALLTLVLWVVSVVSRRLGTALHCWCSPTARWWAPSSTVTASAPLGQHCFA